MEGEGVRRPPSSHTRPSRRSVSLVPPVEAVNGLSTVSRLCIVCSAPKACANKGPFASSDPFHGN